MIKLWRFILRILGIKKEEPDIIGTIPTLFKGKVKKNIKKKKKEGNIYRFVKGIKKRCGD